MVHLNNLSGKLTQLTLHGQLAFIQGEMYDVTKTSIKGVVLVTGVYLVVETQDKLQANIEISEKELEKY